MPLAAQLAIRDRLESAWTQTFPPADPAAGVEAPRLLAMLEQEDMEEITVAAVVVVVPRSTTSATQEPVATVGLQFVWLQPIFEQ